MTRVIPEGSETVAAKTKTSGVKSRVLILFDQKDYNYEMYASMTESITQFVITSNRGLHELIEAILDKKGRIAQ